MTRAGMLALLALACGDNVDARGQSHDLADAIAEWLIAEGAVVGVVYECDTGQGCPGGSDEYCWPLDERALEAQLGAACQVSWRPAAVIGCAYRCDPPLPKGCNAHCGCFCPEVSQWM